MVVRVCEVDVNLDRLKPGEIPNFQVAVIDNVEMMAIFFDGATIWMRRDQANELAAKLMVHLPSEPKEVV